VPQRFGVTAAPVSLQRDAGLASGIESSIIFSIVPDVSSRMRTLGTGGLVSMGCADDGATQNAPAAEMPAACR
jgi:hypothetical protein